MIESNTLLKPARAVGIIGYGAYVPRYRLPAKEVARSGPAENLRVADQGESRPGAGRGCGHNVAGSGAQCHEARRDRPG